MDWAAMGGLLFLLWPAAGIILHWLWVPYWLRKDDPFMFAMFHFLAVLMGPMLIVLFLIAPEDELDRRWNAQERAKRTPTTPPEGK